MGTVHAEITLKNAVDVDNARTGIIRNEAVRSITVTAVVDTGAGTLVINDEQSQKLGLLPNKDQAVHLADGRRLVCKVVSPVQILWKNRDTTCEAIVVPGARTVLLGAIPLEAMDLMIHPKKQELAGVHGDEAELMLL